MKLQGTVRNVIDFGAFVDIGVHQDGLVHISKLADKFVKHPSEVVRVGDRVEVTVLSVDTDRNRISEHARLKQLSRESIGRFRTERTLVDQRLLPVRL